MMRRSLKAGRKIGTEQKFINGKNRGRRKEEGEKRKAFPGKVLILRRLFRILCQSKNTSSI
jgi:hypothetical protein